MRLRTRPVVAGLTATLLVSIAYNALWLSASSEVLEVACKTHFAAVHADAIKAEEQQDWERAAHLFAYLRDYHPRGPSGCLTADRAKGSWLLPVGSLIVSRSGAPRDAATQEELRKADDLMFERAYEDASSKARASDAGRTALVTQSAQP